VFSTKTGESTIYKKILTYEELTPREQIYLQDAVEYYSYLNQGFIVQALKPSFKLYYHAILKYERFPGVVPFLYGVEGSAATKRIHDRIKNRILEP